MFSNEKSTLTFYESITPLESNTTDSTCIDRVIEMHFPEFSLYSGSEKLLSSSLTMLQKIDMMHSLMSLHRKRLHCILDVSQISLRLTLLLFCKLTPFLITLFCLLTTNILSVSCIYIFLHHILIP